MKKSFTLMELLIVISIIAILAAAVLALLNPIFQIKKSWDSKRKTELSTLRKVLEDWYNDKGCYPKPSDICYNNSNTPIADGTYTCNICGTAQPIRSLSPYISQLSCDPQHPTIKYLYQVDKTDCPTWYRIYTSLSNISDPAIDEVGCHFGCGPDNTYSYNYGVSSPNVGLENAPLCSEKQVDDYWCLGPSGSCCGRCPCCKHCGNLSVCQNPSGGCGSPIQIFNDDSCNQSCHL